MVRSTSILNNHADPLLYLSLYRHVIFYQLGLAFTHPAYIGAPVTTIARRLHHITGSLLSEATLRCVNLLALSFHAAYWFFS